MMDALGSIKEAYITLLKDWPSRHSRDGQDVLCYLRGAIAELEGHGDIESVQNEAESEATKRKFGIC